VPWEISIINGTPEHSEPLGLREDVIDAFAKSLPGVSLQREPPLPTEILNKMPLWAREDMLLPRLAGIFETDELFIRFSAYDEPVIKWVNGEVRGNGDPIPSLAALCLDRGWSVLSLYNKSIVNLSSSSGSPAWKQFCKWRDKAIAEGR
jgi:hypothetical protein